MFVHLSSLCGYSLSLWKSRPVQLPFLLLVAFAFGCARQVKQIRVEVPENYRGRLHIILCAIPPMRADDRGNVAVADCPNTSEAVEVLIRRGENLYKLPQETVALRVDEHGFVSIDTALP